MTIENYLAEIRKLGIKFSLQDGLIRDWDAPSPKSPLCHLAIDRAKSKTTRHPFLTEIHKALGMSKLDIIAVYAAEDGYSNRDGLRDRIMEALGLQN